MTRPALALACLLAACTAGPRAVGSEPSWRHSSSSSSSSSSQPSTTSLIPVTFAPTTEPARSYNEPVEPPPHTPLGDAAIAAVRDAALQAHLPPPVADARLFRACAELAAIVPEDGVVDYSLVEFALQRNGIIEPSPHLMVVWGDVGSPDLIVQQIIPRLADSLAAGATARLGIGAAKRRPDGTGAVVFALQASGLTTAPIPRALPDGGSFSLDATVDARFHDPEVFVTHDDGTTEQLALAAHGGAFQVPVACGKHHGRQEVEIGAVDTSGSTVLANFPVYCGTQPPASVTYDPRGDVQVSASEAEHRLFELINRDRKAAGLPALVWDDQLAAVARAHSDEMRRTHVVAHVSPTTGSAADRVRAAGIHTAVVLENVARAYGVEEAHQGLMNSPGHRENVLSAVATHVGVGVVYGDAVAGRREMLLTQVFIRVPPKVDPVHAAEVVRQRLAAVRAVTVDPQLQAVAQQLAAALAAGKSRDDVWPGARKQLDALGARYARVGSVVTAVADLVAVDGKELLGTYQPSAIGVGIAQGYHPDIGDHAIWIVVLMAEPRAK